MKSHPLELNAQAYISILKLTKGIFKIVLGVLFMAIFVIISENSPDIFLIVASLLGDLQPLPIFQ